MVLAFKLHGDFAWPPSTLATDLHGTRAGTLEVWLLQRSGTFRAALRFIPGQSSRTHPALEAVDTLVGPSASQYIAAATDAYIAEPLEEPLPALWMDDAAGAGGITFRGASVIEEFGENGELVLQLPLANGVVYGNSLYPHDADGMPAVTPDTGSGVSTFSGFRVYAEGDTGAFALHVHLPIPVRQSKESSARAFPLTVKYPAAWQSPPALPLRIAEISGGWVNDAGHGGTGIKLAIDGIPEKQRWFGGFGFSERGTKSGAYRDEFVVYRHTVKAADAGHYWPSNGRCFVDDVVNSYGFSISPVNWVDFSDSDPADLSLRFQPRTDAGPVLGVVYRVRVDRDLEKGIGNAGSDLTAYEGEDKKGVLAIRLARELGGVLADTPYFGEDGSVLPDVEGWLRTGTRLSADLALTWNIGARLGAADRTRDWRPTVTLRLHWAENVSPGTAGAVHANEVFRGALIGSASHSFARIREALPEGETGQPGSFLPDLALTGNRSVRFCLYGTPIAATVGGDNLVTWGQQLLEGMPTIPWERPPMRLTLASERDLIKNTGDRTEHTHLKVSAEGISFFRTPRTKVDLTLGHDEGCPPTGTGTDDSGFFASYSVAGENRKGWSGRLASLDFRADDNPTMPDEPARGHLRIGGRGGTNRRQAERLLYPEGRIAAEISLPLAVSEITPVTIDVQRFDRSGRTSPLLIDLGPRDGGGVQAEAGTPVRYWLRATETIVPREDRKLFAEIFDQARDAPLRSYAVLAAQPFSVFRFTEQPIASRGDQEGTSVAVYGGDTRGWQYKLVSPHYRYSLPPQSVGESADKPGRLEIHDLGEDEHPVPRPFVRHISDDGTFDEAASNRDRRALEFRLTPSAELWVKPSDVARGYFMPQAASHDIFRQYGAYGLGAALAYLRGENLYGLSYGIDVSKEATIARGARVAEIEAIVGRLVGPARETDAEPLVADRWEALRDAFAGRPERLEVWARDPESDVDFTPARFTGSVAFSLRGTALHRAPVIDGGTAVAPEGEAAHGAWPRVGNDIWPPQTEPDAPPVPRDAVLPRHHPQGLSGGALWPVESLNLFNALLVEPLSSGGTMERIALSPMGGDATQKAEFLGGIVAIISETYNGRVQRLQLEVIGRIAALWHRAKHVVVYERTVNPSAQFAPKSDPARTRTRRPVLRKVREYIELLQPERGYPDFSAATTRNAGFLDRVRFNSRIINVDSAWSTEVGTKAWQIPLWNRFSARERPQVYPLPDIAFVTAAEGEGERPVVAQECLDPDHLYFFADFDAGSSDTDTWDARLAIDYANMPSAASLAKASDVKQAEEPGELKAGAPEPRRPPVTRILPGLRRFTWRLAPAAQKTAINAGRAGKPVFVGLESVSFMRATHQADDHRKLSATLDAAAKVKSAIAMADDGARYWSTDGSGVHGSLASTADTLASQLEALDDLDADAPDYLAAVKVAVRAILDTKPQTDGAIGNLLPDGIAGLPALKSGLPPRELCEKLKADATSTIKRKELLVRTALSDFVADRDMELEAVGIALPVKKADVIDGLTTEATEHLRPLFEEASQDVAELGVAVERAKAIVLDAADEVDAVFSRARTRVQQFRDGYEESKPWSASRRAAFRAGAEAAVLGVVGDVEAAIDEAASRLSVELGDVGQRIAGHIAKALRAVRMHEADVIGTAVRFEGIADGVLQRFDAVLLDTASGAEGMLTKLRQVILADPIMQSETALRDSLIETLDRIVAAVPAAREAARNAGAQLDKQVDAAAADFLGDVRKLSTAIQDSGAGVMLASQALVDQADDLVAVGAGNLVAALKQLHAAVTSVRDAITRQAEAELGRLGSATDAVILPMLAKLDAELVSLRAELAPIPGRASVIADEIVDVLEGIRKSLAPAGLLVSQVEPMIRRTLDALLEPLPAELGVPEDVLLLRRKLQALATEVGALMGAFTSALHTGVDDITAACELVAEGVAKAEGYLNELVANGAQYLRDQSDGVYDGLETVLATANDAEALLEAAKDFDRKLRGLHNDVSRSLETASAYGDRVFDAVSSLGDGDISAAPSKLLKLYSAVTSAPELAALKADIERIRSTFDELGDIIEVTKTNALFNRLGDELKALGLSIPFDKIGDSLLPADLSKLDIGSVFRNFGGAKLDRLFKGYKIPAGVRDAVKITHDFDKKLARAWVQVDISAPFPGRRSLFSMGVFKADFVDMLLSGRVRLEVSSEQEKVEVTGFGHIATTLDAVVGGQSMVKFEKFGLEFTKEKGLDVQFDPKNAKLNPQFKWIQDFLSGMFPDLGGGLEWIRENGIAVGVQHDFVLPPLSLTFGTSGVSNISIENHFKLVAFPDFLIADRFNLSSIDRPFIFSIFIIGGTGYIQIEAEYRPLDKDSELTVLVEAGAGGSAQLAFAFGPFIGQIFITISGVLTYRKVLGKPGGGLSIAMVLVICGQVDVCGIVTVGITLMLRMSYRDSGQVDADGTLTVTIRISRFFKLRARAQVNYKLRGGKSETTTGVDGGVELTGQAAAAAGKAKQLSDAARKLEGALN